MPGSSIPLILGRRQIFSGLEPVIESISVTISRALEIQFTAPLTQGFATFDTHSAEASSVVGSLPFGQPASQPLLASGPLSILPLGLPTNGTPTM